MVELKRPELFDSESSHSDPKGSQSINTNSREQKSNPSKSLNKVLVSSSGTKVKEDCKEALILQDQQIIDKKSNTPTKIINHNSYEPEPQPIIDLKDEKVKPNKDSLNTNNYELVQEKPIGEGGNGTIYLVCVKGEKDNYAMKIIRKPRNPERLSRVRREVEIFKHLKYRFLVKPAKNWFFEDKDYIYIVMEYHMYYLYIIIVMVI